jgi:hypothetical protein
MACRFTSMASEQRASKWDRITNSQVALGGLRRIAKAYQRYRGSTVDEMVACYVIKEMGRSACPAFQFSATEKRTLILFIFQPIWMSS